MTFFFRKIFGLHFPGLQVPPNNSRPKFTPKIVGIPLQFHFLEPNSFHACFLPTGETNLSVGLQRRKRKMISAIFSISVIVASCCALCVPNMLIAKANVNGNLEGA